LTFASEYQKLMKAPGEIDKNRESIMQPTNWAPEHSDALREFITQGMSFSEAARAINSDRNQTANRSQRFLNLRIPEPRVPCLD